ncbi:hypothetical protein RSAG8_13792, partial [Rhizoctonia solani AG-8 WAC10335]
MSTIFSGTGTCIHKQKATNVPNAAWKGSRRTRSSSTTSGIICTFPTIPTRTLHMENNENYVP